MGEVLVILKRDMFLRFIKSNLYEKLVLRGRLVYDFEEKNSYLLPKGNRLQVKIPESRILNDVYSGQIMNHKDENKLYELQEILTDGLLFNELLSRLKSLMCSESILCVRMIVVFKETVSRCLSQSAAKSFTSHCGMKKFNSVRSAGRGSHNSSFNNWNMSTNVQQQQQQQQQQQNLNQLDVNVQAQQLLQQSSPNFHTNLTIVTDTISNSNSHSNLLNLNSSNLLSGGGGIGTNGIATNNSTNTGTFSTPRDSIPRSNSYLNLQLMTHMVTSIGSNLNSNNNSNSNINSNLNSSTNSNKNSTTINRKFSETTLNVKSNKGKIAPKDMNIILDKAWEIYLFFLAKGSAYEISIPNNQRIEIMRMLGNPNLTMFDQLESIAMRELVHCFKNYKESKYYPFLNKSVLRTASKIKNIELGSDSFFTRKFKKAFRSNLCKVYAI